MVLIHFPVPSHPTYLIPFLCAFCRQGPELGTWKVIELFFALSQLNMKFGIYKLDKLVDNDLYTKGLTIGTLRSFFNIPNIFEQIYFVAI